MFCPDCGSEVAEGRKFCGKCGGQIHAAAGSIETTPSAAPQEIAAPAPRHPLSTRQKLTYALVALLVVLCGVGWWWMHRPAPAYKAQDPGIYPFQGLSADGKTQKWGFIDADGKVLIQPQWDGFAYSLVLGQPVAFSESLCGVLKDGKWGYIDTSNKLVIPNQFDSAGPFIEGLARVNLGSQVGFIDKTGQYAINPQFYQAGDFHGGLAAVRGDGGWGFINKAGTFVIKPHFQAGSANGFSEGLAAVCLNGMCGYINREGTFAIKPQFNSVNDFSEGLAAVQLNGKWGYVNAAGKIAINPQFGWTSMFSGGNAAVGVVTDGNILKTGTINKQGKYVVNLGLYSLGQDEGDVRRAESSDGVGLITNDGKWIVKPSKVLSGASGFYGKVFYGNIQGIQYPISISGKVLTGPYKGAMLDTLAQDMQNENMALMAMISLVGAETNYSAAYPAKGFADSLSALGPAQGTANETHAGLIEASLATGTANGYQFAISIPAGTSTGGTNFNYFVVGKPAAGHAGRAYCADSSGSVHSAVQGEECTAASPTAWSPQQDVGSDTPQTPH